MSKDIHDKLQEYLDGSLSPDMRSEIENEIKTNLEIQKEYQLLKDIETELGNQDLEVFKKKLSNVAKKHSESVGTKNQSRKIFSLPRRVLSIAASIAILVAGFLWVQSNNQSTGYDSALAYYDFNELYSEGLKGDVGNPSEKEMERKEVIDKIKSKEYNEVIELLNSTSLDENESLLLGHAYISKGISEGKLGHFKTAILIVSSLLQSENIKVKEETEWLLLIGYSKDVEKEAEFNQLLNSIISNRDHIFYGKAVKVKEQLNR